MSTVQSSKRSPLFVCTLLALIYGYFRSLIANVISWQAAHTGVDARKKSSTDRAVWTVYVFSTLWNLSVLPSFYGLLVDVGLVSSGLREYNNFKIFMFRVREIGKKKEENRKKSCRFDAANMQTYNTTTRGQSYVEVSFGWRAT